MANHFRTLDSFHLPHEQPGPAPEVLVEDRDAVILADVRLAVKATGRHYRARCALRVTVENGAITRCHAYENGLTVAQALMDGGAQ